MKRTHLTKFAAVIAAVLVVSASAVLPALAGTVMFCTAEAVGSEQPPFDILTSAGNEAAGGTGIGDAVGNAVGDAVGDIGNAVDDLLPGDQNVPDVPADENRPAEENDPNRAPADQTPDNRVPDDKNTAGQGKLEEGQAGGDENGIVGDGTGGDSMTGDTAGNRTDSGVNPADGETAVQETTGTSWASIIVALVIAVALVVVIVALIPRKRTD